MFLSDKLLEPCKFVNITNIFAMYSVILSPTKHTADTGGVV